MLVFISNLNSNTTIQEYTILTCLGKGGFGTTYLCFDQLLNRNCVIKEYTPHRIAYRKNDGSIAIKNVINQELYYDGLADFLKEAQRLALFSHPNIVRINRFFKQNNTGYFVMDYERGDSLRNVLNKRTKEFDEIELEKIILPLCEGLKLLHNSNLIHRDIKPDNIILRENGSPVLIDFGAVGNLKSLSSDDYKIYFTPHYAPIEQYSTKLPQGPWIDIYALSATVYELIAGNPPKNSIDRLKNDDLVPIKHIGRGKYGTKLLSLIDRGLSVNYIERPVSIDELLSIMINKKYFDLRNMVSSITMKARMHFTNFAKPNQGLIIDEFVTFILGFSVIDLTWRLGKGRLIDDEVFNAFIDDNVIREYLNYFEEKGFHYNSRVLTTEIVRSRMDEYAATYLLDRQKENWAYKLTLKQCAKNCITKEFESEIDGFIDLMEGVINRYRGRIKRELEKRI